MVKALFDTNILIDYLGGIGASKKEFARYEYKAISTITWMEVLVGTTTDDEAAIRAFEIRKDKRIRLPDAIVWASAQVNSLLLVSRNTKDFPADEPGVRVPYKL
jgi:predicted nucleic acid-binding protein